MNEKSIIKPAHIGVGTKSRPTNEGCTKDEGYTTMPIRVGGISPTEII